MVAGLGKGWVGGLGKGWVGGLIDWLLGWVRIGEGLGGWVGGRTGLEAAFGGEELVAEPLDDAPHVGDLEGEWWVGG